MQQEIKLTNESSNTVLVDNVDVSKGVYAIRPDKSPCYVFNYKKTYYIVSSSAKNSFFQEEIFNSLKSLMIDRFDYEFYTIPNNKRIVTEREVTIDNLRNTDHVGFVGKHGDKGFIICNGHNKFTAISGESYGASCNGHYSGDINHETLKCALSKVREPKQIIRFTTRKELYQWLAE